ncbi:sugar-transfer associated ATP-grasp domain-containing protein [Paenibacillus solisilvae]|uniref:Sugar-transfer associated ATP-grasp domain-containing protein n=1 Tax=Paenibacillus solisilvae TaxID=2486751 RepID=A0ABW0W2J4_9BACL
MLKKTVLQAARLGGIHIQLIMAKSKYRDKLNRLIRANGMVIPALTSDLQQRTQGYWERYYGAKINLSWHAAYAAVTGYDDERYIPEDLFFMEIEPALNRKELYRAYVDKSNFNQILTGFASPALLFKMINGAYLDSSGVTIDQRKAEHLLLEHQADFVIKPCISEEGSPPAKWMTSTTGKLMDEGSSEQNFEQLIATFHSGDFIVQECVKQHKELARVYPVSINSLRLLTLRFKGGIYLLCAGVRFGSGGSKVSEEAGILFCSVGVDGRLSESATDSCGRRYDHHPYTNYAFGQTRIPAYGSLVRHVESLHDQLHYFDLISWDFALSPSGSPVLLEIHLTRQEINSYQFNDGPLFGQWTEEILQLVKERKNTVRPLF